MKRLAFSLALVAAVATAGTSALAQAPSTMSYQGVLTDAVGNIVPDGAYTLTFRIYDVAVAGAPLWTEAHAAVPLVKGGFSVILGEIAPLALPFDRQYWLGVQVFADPELDPRVKLAASPYAASLRLPFSQALNSTSSLLQLYNSGTGAAITADPELNVGNIESGNLRIYRGGLGNAFLQGFTVANGGMLRLFDEVGSSTFQLEPDNSNLTGGYFNVYRSTGLSAFQVDINGNEPNVTITGSARSAAFDMAASGNASVALPSDAISAIETLDEPGVAAAADDLLLNMDGTVQTLLSRTITVPAAGYVVAIASSQLNISQINGTGSGANFGVSDVAGILPTNQDMPWNLPSTAPTGSYFPTIAVHGTFAVAAGAHTFYFLGQENAGTYSVNDRQLTLMYFPTAYGTVVTAPQGIASGGDELSGPRSFGRTAADIAAEQAEARSFNEARLARELAEVRAQLDAIERRLAETAAVQAAADGGK